MLRPVSLILTLALGLLAAPLAADAQPPAKVARIGWLNFGDPTSRASQLDAFRQGLRERGWVEGQNLVIEYRWAEGKLERLPDLAAELVRLKVDAIVAAPLQAIQAAKQVTTTIPIVMPVVGDPVEAGFVSGLARPGGNITGLTLMNPELSGKRLDLLKEIVPGLTRVAVLSNPANPGTAPQLRETQLAARVLGLQLQVLEVRDAKGFDSAFSAMTRDHAGALNILGDPMLTSNFKRLADLALKSRRPTMSNNARFPEVGGLMAYGPNIPDMFRRAATFVDRILKGAKPADLPVEQPTRFELVINMKTAKALGLTIPQSILIRADRVIQ